MFLKLTDNDTQMDVYLNPNHIVRFVPNTEGEGTLVFLSGDAALAPKGEPQLLVVHESAEEVFRIICRGEKGPAGSGAAGGGRRGLI